MCAMYLYTQAFSIFLMLSLAALLVWTVLWFTQKWYNIHEEHCEAQTDTQTDVAAPAEKEAPEIAA